MQNRYKYQGEYHTIAIVEELILELFAGTARIKRGEIKETVLGFHESQGGLVGPHPLINNALAKLKEKDLVEHLDYGYWRIF